MKKFIQGEVFKYNRYNIILFVDPVTNKRIAIDPANINEFMDQKFKHGDIVYFLWGTYESKEYAFCLTSICKNSDDDTCTSPEGNTQTDDRPPSGSGLITKQSPYYCIIKCSNDSSKPQTVLLIEENYRIFINSDKLDYINGTVVNNVLVNYTNIDKNYWKDCV